MRKLHFDYWMEISFTEPVKECHYTIKCLPQDTDMQQISELKIELIPEHDYQRGVDSFGNLIIYDNLYIEHQKFGFRISGNVKTGLFEGERIKDGEFAGIYRYSHGLNKAGQEIKCYYAEQIGSMERSEDTAYQKAVYLMNCLHRDFQYRKGVTDINTTAEEAFGKKQGVCQDYAHILIALCHLAGVPARYVTGMMYGEGFSHAWVEILSDGIWYGLDPTNGCMTGDSYIKIGVGRDANDCLINKGMMTGGGWQEQSVVVRVEEVKGEDDDKNSCISGTSC